MSTNLIQGFNKSGDIILLALLMLAGKACREEKLGKVRELRATKKVAEAYALALAKTKAWAEAGNIDEEGQCSTDSVLIYPTQAEWDLVENSSAKDQYNYWQGLVEKLTSEFAIVDGKAQIEVYGLEFDTDSNELSDYYTVDHCKCCGQSHLSNIDDQWTYGRCSGCDTAQKWDWRAAVEPWYSDATESFDDFKEYIAEIYGDDFDGIQVEGSNMGWQRRSGYTLVKDIPHALDACTVNGDWRIYNLNCGKGLLSLTLGHHDGTNFYNLIPYWHCDYIGESEDLEELIFDKEKASALATEIWNLYTELPSEVQKAMNYKWMDSKYSEPVKALFFEDMEKAISDLEWDLELDSALGYEQAVKTIVEFDELPKMKTVNVHIDFTVETYEVAGSIELLRLLAEISDKIDAGREQGAVMDINGNKIGEFSITQQSNR